jgi:hypothetical protein
VPAAAALAQEAPQDELIVTFTTDEASGVILNEVGVEGAVEVTPLVVEVRVTEEEAVELRAHPGVIAVEPERTLRLATLPDDPCITGCPDVQHGGTVRTDYLERLGVPQAWERSTAAGVELAVIDGGVELADPDLAGRVFAEWDYLGGAPGNIAHGTAVAALAAAATGDAVGIPGIAREASIGSFKVFSEAGTATELDVVDAIRDATDMGAKVINLSFSGPDIASVRAEVQRSISLGVVVVAAAGNIEGPDGQDPYNGYPARYPDVIAVGASTPSDEPASFSFRGPWVDVFAPGVALAVPYAPGGGYTRFDGTSGAAPIVAGAVALLETEQPGLTPVQVGARLRATSIPLGDGSTGERRVQIGSFVRGMALGPISTPSPIGSLDAVSVGPAQVTVRGWAIDPSTTVPIAVHVYVDGVATPVTASGQRADIGAVLPGYGPAHGYAVTASAGAGTHNVCAYGIDVGPGGNALLGCRSVVVGGSPIGALDIVRQVPGGVQVSGWALDPDVAGPIDVHAYAAGAGIATTANRPRADIGHAYPLWGPNHGYLTTIPTSASAYVRVCTYGIDVGAGGNSALGCRSLQLRQSPFGSIDSLSRSGNQVRVRGWALDPSTAASIDVHVYVSPGGATASNASLSRPDIGAAFPGYGAAHGFDVSVSAAPGAQVCVYGIDVGAGGNALLGCRTAP